MTDAGPTLPSHAPAQYAMPADHPDARHPEPAEDPDSRYPAPAGTADPSAKMPGISPGAVTVTRRVSSAAESVRANRRWWDEQADSYQAEHGGFLGDVQCVWGPEGLNEAQVRLLGDVAGRRVLEIGCGAGQCGRWLVSQGAQAVGVDLSGGQLRHARRINAATGVVLPVSQADARRLPFRTAVFDLAFSSYGALAFVADADAVLREVARVLRPGGRFVFSTTHPFRWSFLDDPGEDGLVVVHSYFDRRAYVEQDQQGHAVYVEQHRTMGDWVGCVVHSGLHLIDLIEPEWPEDHDRTWGGWSRLRGRLIPGTAIFVCAKPNTVAPLTGRLA